MLRSICEVPAWVLLLPSAMCCGGIDEAEAGVSECTMGYDEPMPDDAIHLHLLRPGLIKLTDEERRWLVS